jgi:hypothetical protein
MSNFRWGLIIALAPIAVPFVLWPLWWLAGCEPTAHAVHCKNAVWYGPVAMAILNLPWLALLSIPAGFIFMLFGPVPSGTQALYDPSAMPREVTASDKEKGEAD